MSSEQRIIQGLINSWLPLALEYAAGAPDVTKLFVYAGSEPGQQCANSFYEQGGVILYPSKLKGAGGGPRAILDMQRHMIDDLNAAEKQFVESSIPCPTEYRIEYDLKGSKLDVQLSRELKYSDPPDKSLIDGPEDWLDGRLDKHFGRLVPGDREWRE
ncbi:MULTISPECIES: hypothetical protein [Clavibacter]|uniref:hypothetical protein n=1 Tax=Clavibacter TaxID=1573 RepID=UPI0010426FA4|nr:hypothetical protein [Clavibacter michiganensis]